MKSNFKMKNKLKKIRFKKKAKEEKQTLKKTLFSKEETNSISK